jgi:hypothetical protein
VRLSRGCLVMANFLRARSSSRRVSPRSRIAGRQVLPEKARGGDTQGTPAQHVQDLGTTPCRASRRDAVAGRVLGQPQLLAAVREERRVAGRQVEAALVEFDKVRDELSRGLALTASHTLQFSHELIVGQVRRDADLHASFYHADWADQVRRRRRALIFAASMCALIRFDHATTETRSNQSCEHNPRHRSRVEKITFLVLSILYVSACAPI